MESPPRYTPQLRTALVLTGTGTAGAYHAGVLRALHEAGVKIDLVAGRGIGVIGAMFGAVDGGARLWAADGLWRAPGVGRLYRWRAALRAASAALAVALAAVAFPLVVLVFAVIALSVGYLLRVVGIDAGQTIAGVYPRWLEAAFAPSALPVYLPRFVFVAVLVFLAVLTLGAIVSTVRSRARRRSRGALWWRLVGTPLDVSGAVTWFSDGLWRIMRGAARIATPSPDDLGDRYAELLAENLGQPGFRELIMSAHDLDARRDITFALLAEPHRRGFLTAHLGDGTTRQLDTVDLTGAARRHATDALAAALSLPVATEPHLMTFSPNSAWKGETHRVCDRPDATTRLLEEVANAGAEQVIVVSALPRAPGPHTLSAGRRDIRGRAGEHLAAIETAALRDAIASRAALFQALFEVRPTHNPLGPFDFEGCYDERSDRRQTLGELIDRGYEDGFRQFVGAVVGASGERLEHVSPRERGADGPMPPRERGVAGPAPPRERGVAGPVTPGGSISERLAAHGDED